MAGADRKRIVVENVNQPGKTREVDAEPYGAVCDALSTILPDDPPGMTLSEIRKELPPCSGRRSLDDRLRCPPVSRLRTHG